MSFSSASKVSLFTTFSKMAILARSNDSVSWDEVQIMAHTDIIPPELMIYDFCSV
jgi:hypothetical protein